MKASTSFLATAIGSLPHTNSAHAVNFIFETFPDIPVLPQLANINPREDMTSQLNEKIPGIVFDEDDKRWYMDQDSETFCEEVEEFLLDFEEIVNENNFENLEKYAISNEYCSALPLFLEKLKETKPTYAKAQIIGPFTFATSLIDREKRCVFYDETLKEIIVKGLILKALWLVKKIKEASVDTTPIIFMDEPSISQYGTSAFITVKKEDVVSCFSEITSVLKKAGAIVGVHCCGNSDWSLITESGADILNFDGFYYAESLGLYLTEITSFLQNGGKIAWGVVPTMDTDCLEVATLKSSIDKYEEAISYLLNKGINKDVIFDSTLITPACGAGNLTAKQAEKAMQLTAGLAQSLKNKYNSYIENK
ncbi:MAG: hypothetical protein ACOCUV_01900 [bacterium]